MSDLSTYLSDGKLINFVIFSYVFRALNHLFLGHCHKPSQLSCFFLLPWSTRAMLEDLGALITTHPGASNCKYLPFLACFRVPVKLYPPPATHNPTRRYINIISEQGPWSFGVLLKATPAWALRYWTSLLLQQTNCEVELFSPPLQPSRTWSPSEPTGSSAWQSVHSGSLHHRGCSVVLHQSISEGGVCSVGRGPRLPAGVCRAHTGERNDVKTDRGRRKHTGGKRNLPPQ